MKAKILTAYLKQIKWVQVLFCAKNFHCSVAWKITPWGLNSKIQQNNSKSKKKKNERFLKAFFKKVTPLDFMSTEI